MSIATLTTKGQLTLPKDVREALHLSTGDKLEVFISGENELTLRPLNRSVEDVFGSLSKYGSKRLSVEDIDKAVAELMSKSV